MDSSIFIWKEQARNERNGGKEDGGNTIIERKNDMTEEELTGYFWLCGISGIGAVSVRRLLERAETVKGVLALSRESEAALIGPARAALLERAKEEKRLREAARRLEGYREKGIFFLPLPHPAYPSRLKEIPDPPVALYGKGKLPEMPCAAAVIGTRECSEYGRQTTRYFAAGLARAGVTVVSGLARGVDGIAGRAAMEAGGFSAAVLGCGVDLCYPPENRPLYEWLEREGCLLSEYPPGTRPEARLFPARNRIISGLSDLVLVTEARERSGTLITVDMALEQGREVYAVPGRITDTCSRGCNRLIAGGAGAALSVPQLLRALHMDEGAENAGTGEGPESGTDGEEKDRAESGSGKGAGAGRTGEKPAGEGAESKSSSGGGAGREKPKEEPPVRPLTASVLRALDCDPRTLDEILERLRERPEEQNEDCRREPEEARSGQEIPSRCAMPGLPELMEELLLLCLEGRAACRAGLYTRTDLL